MRRLAVTLCRIRQIGSRNGKVWQVRGRREKERKFGSAACCLPARLLLATLKVKSCDVDNVNGSAYGNCLQ